MPAAKPQEISDEVYVSLVDSLFKEARSLLLGSVFTGLAMIASFLKTGHWLFLAWAIAFFLVAAVRMLGIQQYNRSRNAPLTRCEAEQWERLYAAGATVSVCLLGTWCFLAFAITTEPFVQLVSFALTIGYIIGIFGRNFANSQSATIQTLSAWLPMTAGLLLFGDTYHWFFAVLLAPLFLAVKFLANRIRSVLLEAIEARAKAEAALRDAEDAALKAREARARVLELVSRLRQSRRSEEAAIATRDQHMRFLATMSHEIRTPLNGIVGALDLMRTSRSEKLPALLDTATSSADALLDLVSEVLDLAKLDYVDGVLDCRAFRVRDLTEVVRLALAPIASGKGLSLTVNIDDDIPDALFGDPAKIRQVLINLVGNALKFTDTGAVTLSVRLLARDNARASIEFEVRDTGIGMSRDDIDHIYEPFFTGKASRRETQSSGLGLSIVEKAVSRMKGSIQCESDMGVGTAFKVQLALAIDDNPAAIPADTPSNPVVSHAAQGRILLVEDNWTNAMIVRDMLEDTPHLIDHAAGGLDAVRMATEQDYDVILMDISMPDLDGLSACQRIRAARGSSLKSRIVALTANAVVGDRERFLGNGFDGYLSKPIRRTVLLDAIDDMLTTGNTECRACTTTAMPAAEPSIDEAGLAQFIEERSPERACRLLGIFSSELAKHKDNIEAGYESAAPHQVHHSLHSIVGMAGSVGATQLSALARRHEQVCRTGTMPTDADMGDLIQEVANVIKESARMHQELRMQVT